MRYGAQWTKWIEARLKARTIEYEIVNGDEIRNHTDEIQTGQFLDAHRTNYWKLTQVAKVVEMLQQGKIVSGDKIFSYDLWHCGLEAIPYITALTKQNIEIYGIWEAGTHDESDYITKEGMGAWGDYYEQSIMKFVKMSFVGSEHHKKILTANRIANVKVTGLPLNTKEIRKDRIHVHKENIVVNTSRLAEDKMPHIYKHIKDRVLAQCPSVRFIETHKLKLDKEAYYNLLSKAVAVVSTAEHENFGIGVVEAMALNCIPVVPDWKSYRDYVPESDRYHSTEQAIKWIVALIWNLDQRQSDTMFKNVEKYDYSIDAMLDSMGYPSSEYV